MVSSDRLVGMDDGGIADLELSEVMDRQICLDV
jgi:hypothetical protein